MDGAETGLPILSYMKKVQEIQKHMIMIKYAITVNR
jgi:hypothetical protein